MTDTSQQRVQVDPLAALQEALALNEYYRNRSLWLANDGILKARGIEAVQAELDAVRTELAQVAVAEDGVALAAEPELDMTNGN